jgi:uncharacterized protein YbjT (DUF2867 family)
MEAVAFEIGGMRMKIVVIGGTGLVGRTLVSILQDAGHQTVVAARSRGINAVTGEGLSFALANADVVIDVSNGGYAGADDMLEFFQQSGSMLMAAEVLAGVRHHIVLSAIGSSALRDVGYFRAKHAQEEIVRASGLPFTILRSTPFFEFIYNIVDAGGVGNTIRLPPVMMQPVSGFDVATALGQIALAEPRQGVVELAGPELYHLHELGEEILVANEDLRDLKVDPDADYFGGPVGTEALVGGVECWRSQARFDDWLRETFVVADQDLMTTRSRISA